MNCEQCTNTFTCLDHRPQGPCNRGWRTIGNSNPHKCVLLVGNNGQHLNEGGHVCCCGAGLNDRP